VLSSAAGASLYRQSAPQSGSQSPATRKKDADSSNLGHELAHGTISNILKRNAIEPALERVRKTTWKEFLSRHWKQIVAAGFFTIKVWTRQGLRPFMGVEASGSEARRRGFVSLDEFRQNQKP
jgi:hypothetical protein